MSDKQDDEYHINCIADFLKVPAEKQAECLECFALWLDSVRDTEKANAKLQLDFPGGGASLNINGFVWIDDGRVKIIDAVYTQDGRRIEPENGVHP